MQSWVNTVLLIFFFGSALRLNPNYQEAKNNQWLVQQKIN